MYIQLNGQVLSYEKEGEGRPLIFLHGNGESHEIWDRMIAEMAMDYTVYAIDSRGQVAAPHQKNITTRIWQRMSLH